jgi:signal peptidase I
MTNSNDPNSPWLIASSRRTVLCGLVLLSLGMLFRSHYRLSIVSGDSMAPTLKSGDLLIVDRRAYHHAEPVRGDIVVMRYSNGLAVKRIVGLPSEEVEVRRGNLYINSRPVNENHRVEPGDLDVEKGHLLRGDFATLGDNRAIPAVLAVHPIVTKTDLLGKVVLILGKHLL